MILLWIGMKMESQRRTFMPPRSSNRVWRRVDEETACQSYEGHVASSVGHTGGSNPARTVRDGGRGTEFCRNFWASSAVYKYSGQSSFPSSVIQGFFLTLKSNVLKEELRSAWWRCDSDRSASPPAFGATHTHAPTHIYTCACLTMEPSVGSAFLRLLGQGGSGLECFSWSAPLEWNSSKHNTCHALHV